MRRVGGLAFLGAAMIVAAPAAAQDAAILGTWSTTISPPQGLFGTVVAQFYPDGSFTERVVTSQGVVYFDGHFSYSDQLNLLTFAISASRPEGYSSYPYNLGQIYTFLARMTGPDTLVVTDQLGEVEWHRRPDDTPF